MRATKFQVWFSLYFWVSCRNGNVSASDLTKEPSIFVRDPRFPGKNPGRRKLNDGNDFVLTKGREGSFQAGSPAPEASLRALSDDLFENISLDEHVLRNRDNHGNFRKHCTNDERLDHSGEGEFLSDVDEEGYTASSLLTKSAGTKHQISSQNVAGAFSGWQFYDDKEKPFTKKRPNRRTSDPEAINDASASAPKLISPKYCNPSRAGNSSFGRGEVHDMITGNDSEAESEKAFDDRHSSGYQTEESTTNADGIDSANSSPKSAVSSGTDASMTSTVDRVPSAPCARDISINSRRGRIPIPMVNVTSQTTFS